jgi:DNA-damage-inducible protein D
MSPQSIALFEQKEIRKITHNDEWWFVISDIIEVLTDSKDPTGYIKDMRRRDDELSKGWGQIATPLAIDTAWGKQKINCANTQGILRLIQSIPSQKAEPFKRWLAQVGYERIQEIEDPELAMKRMRETYEAKGRSKEWIDKRIRGIAIRKDLTDEWDERGIEKKEYWILTAEISRATFGMTPMQHKEYKWLTKKSQNLRDHMTDLETIFTQLGEASTTEIMRKNNAEGFEKIKQASKAWGTVAGNARKALEEQTQQKVVSKSNYLPPEKKKLK